MRRILALLLLLATLMGMPTTASAGGGDQYWPGPDTYVDNVFHPDNPKWVLIWTQPNGSPAWEVVAEAPRRSSGTGGTIRFAPGEVLFAGKIVFDDGMLSGGNCYLPQARTFGWLTDGTANPWSNEVAGKQICAIRGTETTVAQATTPAGCPAASESTFTSPTDVNGLGGPAILHPWWNNGKPNFGQTQVRVKVNSGELATFLGMLGKLWRYADTPQCQAILNQEFGNAPNLPVKSLDDLRRQGLVR